MCSANTGILLGLLLSNDDECLAILLRSYQAPVHFVLIQSSYWPELVFIIFFTETCNGILGLFWIECLFARSFDNAQGELNYQLNAFRIIRLSIKIICLSTYYGIHVKAVRCIAITITFI